MPTTFTADGSLIIGAAALNTMEPAFRMQLFQTIFPGLELPTPGTPLGVSTTAPVEAEDDEAKPVADFTEAEFAILLGGFSEKTRDVLRQVAKGEEIFNLNALAKLLGVEAGKLGGVWSGLTRRTRNLKKASDVEFVSWEWDEKTRSWNGQLSPVTFASMKKAFGI